MHVLVDDPSQRVLPVLVGLVCVAHQSLEPPVERRGAGLVVEFDGG